jgi:hypothetical protein
MIYLEGGGACFDATTCAANPVNVSSQMGQQTGGLFDRTNSSNPVKDWNLVYIPYCTGDIHAGTNANGMVSGVTGTQKFMGRRNMEAFLNRLVPTFKSATQVLFTGVSAGGFGAAANGVLAQRAFSWIKVNLIDDSGPPMSNMYVPTCMQDTWRTLWGLDGSLLADCGAACPNKSDFVLDFAKYQSTLFGDRMAGLIESSTDTVISNFYGIGYDNGAKDCKGAFLLTPIPAATFTMGLTDFRSFIQPIAPNFGTYYPNSSQHTWLGGASLYSQTTGGVAMIDWVTKIVNNVSTSHVGP